jgi:hypothetical protein
MRFGNVDDQESDPPAVLFVEFIEGRNLPPKGRSRVAAEYQNHGLPLIYDRELNALTLVQLEQRKVRRGIANVKGSGAGVKPCRFKRKNHEGYGAGHSGHDPPESFRRLMHGPPHIAPETAITDYQGDK